MDDTERALSIRLYDVMGKIGASEKIGKLYQDTAITLEIIETINNQINSVDMTVYMFGSECEGTTTLDMHSDVDCVNCYGKLPVIDDINTAPLGISSLLMIRDNHTNPGYVKLQIVVDERPRTIFDQEITAGFDTDSTGRVCFKHYSGNRPNDERHGPADTTPEQGGYKSTDSVFAFRCNTIPFFVTEWVRRRRHNAWPSRDDLQTMGGLGCFVVGVGHCISREFDIEWRLSFSLQERLLMFSFNPTQHKCYIILKILKKEVIQQRIGESISSYHCKTCMFYAIENTKANMWKPHKLLTCVRVCLMILLTWVYNGYCPNYFVPSENMFERPCHREIKDDLVQVLRELVSELPSFILHLQGDSVGRMIRDQTIHSQNIRILQYVLYLGNFGIAIKLSNSINKFYNKNGDQRYACLQLFNIIKRLHTTRRIDKHTEQQNRVAISYMIPVLHLHLAQRLVSLAFTSKAQSYCRNILQFSLCHFREVDLFTSKLLIVTFLMRLQYYSICEKILEFAADSLKSHVISECLCFHKPFVINDKLKKLLKDENISAKQFNESCVVTCVQFLPCDTEITPIPLQAEMFRSEDTLPESRNDIFDYWFDFAVVDGKIYLYFLQYLVYSKLNRPTNKRLAITNLIWVLNDDLNLCHKETGYNLLGWIYVQEGRPLDAIRCFTTSWRIRPHHNAAKFHIRKLANDMMQL